ncbi:CHC2 zinc finger domain-containing protein [Chryseobacterium sp. WX]|uniref:CHC2 zinc finger domain-containing protein n=1 Tax=Chryseobacterium sp. WX TaxID=3031803 RepID=UPI002409F9BA|nr:CHC2 zinc finger domain-containing protein [Chryseobacterium sp. WX]WFB67665.1 CHC2 zinc finger domain-containing protein [Chryseobacterium sp. WX]
MTIEQIKSRLRLTEVLQYYNLQPKNNMLLCPWHDDKRASLQVNLDKDFYKCHACGKTGDVIQFMEDYEKLTKHEAIKKAESLINPEISILIKPKTVENTNQPDIDFLENTFSYFRKALYCSVPAKGYIEKRNLDNSLLEIGYNSGQFHHGERKNDELIKKALEAGLLQDKGLINNRTKEKGYSIFANKCIAFPLKNSQNQIVSLYFRSILDRDNGKHFYLKNRSGIYPGYPHKETKKLILTEAIIDCASLLQIKEIRDHYSLISCFGTNGLNDEILNAIKELQQLEEIIFCFDNDKVGKAAIGKYAKLLQDNLLSKQMADGRFLTKEESQEHLMMSQVIYSFIELPCKDVNETLQLHDETIFKELLENRKFIFLPENGSGAVEPLQSIGGSRPFLSAISDEGSNPSNDTRSGTGRSTGLKHQFYENKGSSLGKATTSVDFTQEKCSVPPEIPLKSSIDFLQQKDLLQSLNQLIEKSGIIGEEQSRLLLFLITISYLNRSPLHGIVQGSSGSGKTHMISRIADLMPQEDVLRFTRITESSLYNWGEFDLFQKIIIIEDLDGLKEDALYALREFISNQVLRSSVTIKDKKGNNKSSHKIVKGQFSSLSATTKGETYEDNMNRSFIVAVNESEEQTEKIIHYQNRKNAGEIDKSQEQKAVNQLQNIVRNLKHYEVINPYATQIQLPNNVKNKRRLNEMFQSIIKQITLVHQYQRRITQENYLITEIEDIEHAVEILFESIILKIDELDGSLRQFFEKLKKAFTDDHFTRFEAMEITGFKKTQLQFYLNELVRLEYLKQIGFANKGFKYKISYSDNIQRVRKDLKEAFTKQLEELKQHKK